MLWRDWLPIFGGEDFIARLSRDKIQTDPSAPQAAEMAARAAKEKKASGAAPTPLTADAKKQDDQA